MSAQLWPNDLFPQDPEVQFTNGLSVLTLEEYPDRNLFFGNRVGTTDDGAAVVQWGSLNLEHIFAGIRTANSGDYSPRYEACVLTQVNEHEAQLEWSAEHSAWHASILKRFRLDPAHRQIDVDLEISFSRVPWNPLEVGLRRWLADLGFEAEWGTIDLRHAWIAFMDASYMYMTVKPDIYFYGQAAGQDGWLSVGRKDFTADVPWPGP
jgi:hypothetical protein